MPTPAPHGGREADSKGQRGTPEKGGFQTGQEGIEGREYYVRHVVCGSRYSTKLYK
jgi:hypothetical protein